MKRQCDLRELSLSRSLALSLSLFFSCWRSSSRSHSLRARTVSCSVALILSCTSSSCFSQHQWSRRVDSTHALAYHSFWLLVKWQPDHTRQQVSLLCSPSECGVSWHHCTGHLTRVGLLIFSHLPVSGSTKDLSTMHAGATPASLRCLVPLWGQAIVPDSFS